MYYVMFDEKSAAVADTIDEAVARGRALKAVEPFIGYWWIADDEGIAVDCPEI